MRTGVVISAAALLVATPVRPWSTIVVAVGFALTLAAALWSRSSSAIRVTLVTAVVAASYHVAITFDLPPAPVTVTVCVVLLGAWPVFRRWPALRPTSTWLTAGRFGADVIWLLVALIVGSAGALTVWVLLNDPAPPPFLAGLADTPPWLLVAGMIGFSLVNSVWEEALYRGILQTELAAAWGTAPAVVVQAVAFGFAHVNGFPSGWVGAVLSGGWGLLLGVLRARSGGMVAPYVAHVCADATIAVLAVALLL